MHIEVIANVDIQTNGEWEFSTGIDWIYFNEMVEDGGFSGRIAFFKTADEAIDHIVNVCDKALNGGLYQLESEDDELAQRYIEGIATIEAFYSDGDIRSALNAQFADSFEAEEVEDRFGSIIAIAECGEWACTASVYLRIDGRISPIAKRCVLMHIDVPKPEPEPEIAFQPPAQSQMPAPQQMQPAMQQQMQPPMQQQPVAPPDPMSDRIAKRMEERKQQRAQERMSDEMGWL